MEACISMDRKITIIEKMSLFMQNIHLPLHYLHFKSLFIQFAYYLHSIVIYIIDVKDVNDKIILVHWSATLKNLVMNSQEVE